MPPHVGDGLLGGADHRQLGLGRQAALDPGDDDGALLAGRVAELLGERVQRGGQRLGVVAERGHGSARFFEALLGQLAGAFDPVESLLRPVGAQQQPGALQMHDLRRQGVREDVVDLPGDPGALGQHSLARLGGGGGPALPDGVGHREDHADRDAQAEVVLPRFRGDRRRQRSHDARSQACERQQQERQRSAERVPYGRGPHAEHEHGDGRAAVGDPGEGDGRHEGEPHEDGLRQPIVPWAREGRPQPDDDHEGQRDGGRGGQGGDGEPVAGQAEPRRAGRLPADQQGDHGQPQEGAGDRVPAAGFRAGFGTSVTTGHVLTLAGRRGP
ncbi:hypothetical protein GCM10027612_21750 [Microbispora bryophytorum subsp. camponoti]